MSTEYSTLTAEVVNNDQEAVSEQPNGTFGVAALKEGYQNINFIDSVKYSQSGQTLTEFLKNYIVVNFSSEQFSFIEERDEIKPTHYLKNPRPLKAFVVEDSSALQHIFVFDVAGCLN